MARSSGPLSVSTLVLLLTLPLVASADVVHLKDGGTVSGETERTPAGIRVQQGLGTVLIPHDQVLRVEELETPRQVYGRRKKLLAPGAQVIVDYVHFLRDGEPVKVTRTMKATP